MTIMTLSKTEDARLAGDEIGTRAVLSALLTHLLIQEAAWAPKLRSISAMIDAEIKDAEFKAESGLDRDEVRRAAMSFAHGVVNKTQSVLANAGS
jgi:hypothetical protein